MWKLLAAALLAARFASATRIRGGDEPRDSSEEVRDAGQALVRALAALGNQEEDTQAVSKQLSLAAEAISGNNRSATLISRSFRPLSRDESQAVGAALSRALGVLSGKQRSGDKLTICMGMFPNGAPTNGEQDSTWQACKSELAGVSHTARAALVVKSRHLRPLSTSERETVGQALGQALGVLSGKVKSGSKYSICMDMFPGGSPPPNAASDPTWQSCKGVVRPGGA